MHTAIARTVPMLDSSDCARGSHTSPPGEGVEEYGEEGWLEEAEELAFEVPVAVLAPGISALE